MFKTRTELRNAFRQDVFGRDGHRCKVCSEGSTQLFAHRITDWPNAAHKGFILENGITLCIECKHEALALKRKIEDPPEKVDTIPEVEATYEHHPDQLYQLVRPMRRRILIPCGASLRDQKVAALPFG